MSLHIPTELATTLEEGLSDLSDGTVFHYLHHHLEEIIAIPSGLLQPLNPFLCLTYILCFELLIASDHHLLLSLI